MRFGIANPEIQFPFVSALTFRYICPQKYKDSDTKQPASLFYSAINRAISRYIKYDERILRNNHDIFFANRLSLLRIWLCISTLFFTIETSFALNPSRYATQSQLADGYWVKVAVYESGIHQITYRELRRWGFSGPLGP